LYVFSTFSFGSSDPKLIFFPGRILIVEAAEDGGAEAARGGRRR
jgi:hypothetical protein